MAIIYTYPETKELVGDDLLVVSKYVDDTRLATNSITLSTLAKFLNSAPKMGNGTNFVTLFGAQMNAKATASTDN